MAAITPVYSFSYAVTYTDKVNATRSEYNLTVDVDDQQPGKTLLAFSKPEKEKGPDLGVDAQTVYNLNYLIARMTMPNDFVPVDGHEKPMQRPYCDIIEIHLGEDNVPMIASYPTDRKASKDKGRFKLHMPIFNGLAPHEEIRTNYMINGSHLMLRLDEQAGAVLENEHVQITLERGENTPRCEM